MSIGTRLFTFFCGNKVGVDSFGNCYYEEKKASLANNKKRRWVLYKGSKEPSKIPPAWHAWIHYITDTVPQENLKSHAWEKPHIPNLTGTDLAYFPPGHIKASGKRQKATGDYEAWKPE